VRTVEGDWRRRIIDEIDAVDGVEVQSPKQKILVHNNGPREMGGTKGNGTSYVGN
jgi:hypothetical protein